MRTTTRCDGGRKKRQWVLNMHNIMPARRRSGSWKQSLSLKGACRPEIRRASAETEGVREHIADKKEKVVCVWYEDRNRTNGVFSELNLGPKPTHDELVRLRAMPLGHVCRTDSVKISPLIYIIIDLKRGFYSSVCWNIDFPCHSWCFYRKPRSKKTSE